MEICIHTLIDRQREENTTGDPYKSLIKHRGYRLFMHHQRHRLFLDYYPRRDLARAVQVHFDHRNGGKNWIYFQDDDLNSIVRPMLPEPFIWHVFRELTKAVQVLRYGHDEEEHRPNNWHPMVHRDINDFNIFLGDRQEGDDFDGDSKQSVRLLSGSVSYCAE